MNISLHQLTFGLRSWVWVKVYDLTSNALLFEVQQGNIWTGYNAALDALLDRAVYQWYPIADNVIEVVLK